MSDHPRRIEIMKAAQSGSATLKDHLEECPDCRKLYEIFRAQSRSTRNGMERPSDNAIASLYAIPLKENVRKAVKKLKGCITYDSWTQLPALQLRDAGRGMERRLRLKADDITLELSAERQPTGWDLTARAYRRDDVVTSDYILTADGRQVTASVQECYYWSSKIPPRRIWLRSSELAIDFGHLRWKQTKPRQKN
jgi:hypothetical protein